MIFRFATVSIYDDVEKKKYSNCEVSLFLNAKRKYVLFSLVRLRDNGFWFLVYKAYNTVILKIKKLTILS